MSIAKKLGAVINPIEGGMLERLVCDPDVQSGLLAVIAGLRTDVQKYMQAFTYTNDHNTRLQDENERLRSTLEYVNERIHRIHWLAGLDAPIREQAQMAKDAITTALAAADAATKTGGGDG